MIRTLAVVLFISLVCTGCDEASKTPEPVEKPMVQEGPDTTPPPVREEGNEKSLPEEESELERERLKSLVNDLKGIDPYARDEAAKALVKIGEAAVEPVANAAKHGNWLVRLAALGVLKEIGADKSIETFINALKDQNSIIRGYAATTLGDHPREEATELLLALLGDKDPNVVPNVIYALYCVGDKVVKPALPKLRDENPAIRFYVVTLLGYIGNSGATAPLAEMLKSEKDASIRRMIAWALGMIGDEKAFDPLADLLLKDRSWEIRCAAAKALNDIGDEKAIESLLKAAADANPNVRVAALRALADLGNDKATDSIKEMLKSDPHAGVRSAAAAGLGGIGGQAAVDSLINALDDPDPGVRNAAAAALGKTGDAGALPRLREILKDDDPLVRMGAVLGIARIGGNSAVEPLIEVLKGDPNGGIRCCAAMELGESGVNRALEVLIATLEDADPVVRFGASVALGDIGDASAVNPLSKLKAHSADRSVLLGATYGLFKLTDDPSAIDFIVGALRDEDVNVRANAVKLLGKMGDKKAVEPLIYCMAETGNIRFYALEALKKLTGKNFGPYHIRWRKWFRSQTQLGK